MENRVKYMTYHMADGMQSAINIDPTLFNKLDVKRGLRNDDGSGVLVGLTNISTVDGYKIEGGRVIPIEGRLEFRGYQIEDLIGLGYESIIYLLLAGNLPNPEELKDFKSLLQSKMILDQKSILNIIELEGDNIMNTLARSILELYVFDNEADKTDKDTLIRQSVDLIAKIPLIIAYSYNIYRYKLEGRTFHMRVPKQDVSIAENFLWMIKGENYTQEEVEVLDKVLSLHCEHGGGNNSTFTVRVTSSTGTDTYSAIAAGVGSLKGPKHGGANLSVKSMIDDIKHNINNLTNETELCNYLTSKVNNGELLYGFGHAVYTLSDPRAEILKKYAQKLATIKGKEEDYKFMCLLEKCAKNIIYERKNKYTCANVDFWSGFVYEMIGVPPVLYTPLFAMARVAGWCAHRNEELSYPGARIIRPAYKYTKENQ